MRHTWFTIVLVVAALAAGSVPAITCAGEGVGDCCKSKLPPARQRPLRHRLCECAPPPPDAPILDTVAIRRVSLPQETRYRIEQTAGDLTATTATACGTDQVSGVLKVLQDDTRLTELDARVSRMDQQLNRLLELLQAQQELVDELSRRVAQPQ